MVNLGDFVNEFAAKLHVFLPLVVGLVISMPVYGYFYNQLMNKLREGEHASLYVAIGNLVTLGAGALISWKAALLFLILFALDGLPMIAGEFKRTERLDKSPRRKRLPYAANGLIDEAKMAAVTMNRLMGGELSQVDMLKIQHELTTVLLKLEELKNIQGK